MAALTIEAGALIVTLSRGEKVAGLLRDLRVPLTAVRSADVVEWPLSETRGFRAPGSHFPWLLKMGTWRARHHKSYVIVRRNCPAVRVQLEGAAYDELLVCTPDAGRVREAIQDTIATQAA